MPYEIKLDHLPAGYVLKGAPKGGEVTVCFRDFLSSEDGQSLIHQLEGFPREVIKKLPPEAKADESTTNNLLVVIRKDQTATVYFNEFHPTVLARIKGKVNAGEHVYADNILDIERVKLDAVGIPSDAGVCYVFSQGWRKGLFFDFGPIAGDAQPRSYDLERMFAQCHIQVLFQHIFSIEDSVWDEIFRQGWFPFVHLKQERIKSMLGRAREELPLDDLLNTMRDDLLQSLAERLPTWDKDPIMASHLEFISAAQKHYSNEDYLSASAILYPRIEGIMRTHASAVHSSPSFKQANLAEVSATAGGAVNTPVSLLLPDRFKRYLSEVYFAAFDPKNPQGVSRNTVSHGVVAAKSLDCKAATLAFLILLQISSVSAFAIKPASAKTS